MGPSARSRRGWGGRSSSPWFAFARDFLILISLVATNTRGNFMDERGGEHLL